MLVGHLRPESCRLARLLERRQHRARKRFDFLIAERLSGREREGSRRIRPKAW
jgi:hypothetical protein